MNIHANRQIDIDINIQTIILNVAWFWDFSKFLKLKLLLKFKCF